MRVIKRIRSRYTVPSVNKNWLFISNIRHDCSWVWPNDCHSKRCIAESDPCCAEMVKEMLPWLLGTSSELHFLRG